MKRHISAVVAGFLGAAFFLQGFPAESAEKNLIFTTEPVGRYSFVKGDEEKFRAQQWVKEGFVGGIEEFYVEDKDKDVLLTMEGRALIDENDFSGNVLLKKEDFGFLSLDFREFSRFYDGTGGVYHPFTTLNVNELDKDLELEIGRLTLEAGLTLEDFPEIIFLYERRYKDGAKSRLTWTAVREGSLTRNIGPSWQAVDETTDIFAIRAGHSIAGFDVKGEQRWEMTSADLSREEKSLSTTAIASAKKIRVQDQEVHATTMTTTIKAERWFKEEKTFAGLAYRFLHLTNNEVESIFETDENRNSVNFANPKQIRDATAHNNYDAHTWAGNFLFTPWPLLKAIFHFKSEAVKRDGFSTYPSDTTPAVPDGVINTTEVSDIDNKLVRFGEGISLRYAGIPYTTLYNDLEFEQVRNWLTEDRQSLAGQSASNINEIFSRETITETWRGTWTIGTQANPWPFLGLSGHFRHREHFNNYDDERETNPGTSTARSAFINSLDQMTNEIAARIMLKPCRWFRPSFRYQFRGDDYITQAEGQDNVETDMTSHIYTFDVSLQPVDDLLLTGSFSLQNAWTVTPAVSASDGQTPGFKADVQTFLFTAAYVLNEKTSLTGTTQYSRADNFNDFTSTGLPMGADFEYAGATAGFRYALNKSVMIEPTYGFYRYVSNPDAEINDYDAHVITVKVSTTWG